MFPYGRQYPSRVYRQRAEGEFSKNKIYVEKIKNKKKERTATLYLIKWTDGSATWEMLDRLGDIYDMVTEFELKRK